MIFIIFTQFLNLKVLYIFLHFINDYVFNCLFWQTLLLLGNILKNKNNAQSSNNQKNYILSKDFPFKQTPDSSYSFVSNICFL